MAVKTKRHPARVLFPLLSGLAVFFAALALWEARHWDHLTMEELVNQLATPVEGTAWEIMGGFLLSCILPGLLAGALCAVLTHRRRAHSGTERLERWGAWCAGLACAGLLVYGVLLLDVIGYLRDSNTESAYIEGNYVDPRSVQITFPENKRNLIYIWLESVESTFSDTAHGGAFEQDVIPELTALAEENVSFTGKRGGVNGGRAMAGSTWTMGALFAHTTGLPLKIPITDGSMNSQEHFFPGVTALGDLLAEQGYAQALLIGSKAGFGGRKLFFREHGDYQIWDYNYAKKNGIIPEDYYVWWGYEDARLFDEARRHLEELSAGEEPFNLSILTVDTHFPDGYVCDLCREEYGDQYSDVMACGARQVTAFIRWVQAQPFYENTTIVVSGDHVTMNVGYCDDLPDGYDRRVYTTVIHPAAEVRNPDRFRAYTTFDLFPTTLAALGAEIEGGRLGLGVDLFSGRKTLLERDGAELMERELKRRSPLIDRLSGIREEVFAASELLHGTDTRMSVEFDEDAMYFTVDALQEAAAQEMFKRIEVFAELMNGDTRTTLYQSKATCGDDGRYTAKIPYKKLDGATAFVANIYAVTDDGRIKVDVSYQCDTEAQTLTRIEEEPIE